MLDVQYEGVSIEQRVKKRVFKIQRQLMRSRVQLPLIVMLMLVVLQFYLTSGIFFTQDPFQVDAVNEVFRYPLLVSLESVIGLRLRSLIIILIVFEILGICGYFIMWINSDNDQQSSLVRKFTRIVFLIFRYCIVIITYFILQMDKVITQSGHIDSDLNEIIQLNYTQQSNFHNDPINIFLIFLLNITNLFMILISLPIIFLNINPLRKSNKTWNYNNYQEFINFILNLTRALIISLDGLTTTFIFLSFVCQMFLFLLTKKDKPFTIQNQIQKEFKNNLSFALHLTIFTFMASKDQSISLQLFIILLSLVFIKIVLDFNKYKNRELYLPLCDSNAHQFYNFYFIFQEKTELNQIQTSISSHKTLLKQKVFEIHESNCTSKNCILHYILRERLNDLEYCQKLITVFLLGQKFINPQTHILNELWLLQISAKTAVKIYEKTTTLSLSMQYLMYTVKDSKTNLQSRKQSKSQTIRAQPFYTHIDQSLESFSRFYAQIQKPAPQFQTLIESGYLCKMNTIKLKNVYNQNLKANTLTFKMIEIYLQFQVRYGISQQILSDDWADKAQYLQKNQSQNEINQLYLPTIYVNSITGIIQNSNMSASYFLKMTKFQLKLKPVQEIFQYCSKIQDLTKLVSNKRSLKHRKCIIRKGNGETVCSGLQIKQKTLQNHRVLVIHFRQQKLFHNKNIYVVDQQLKLVKSMRKHTYFKILSTKIANKISVNDAKSGRPLLDWEQVFQNLIKPELQRLKQSKILKLHCHQVKGLLFIVHLQPTNTKQNQLITVTVINDNSQASQNRLSVRNTEINQNTNNKKKKSSVFKFYYHQYNADDQIFNSQVSSSGFSGQFDKIKEALLQKPVDLQTPIKKSQMYSQNLCLSIVGQAINLKEPGHSQYLSSSRNFQSDFLINNISQMIVKQKFLVNNFMSKGIKTYRLWRGSLYNIDLEDKQAYVQNIQENLSPLEEAQKLKLKNSRRHITLYFFVFIIISSIGLSISVFYLFNDSINDFQTILVSYKKQMIMQSIYMSYNKINAVFRDVENGMYRQLNQNWKADIIISFNSIKKKRMLDLNLFKSEDLEFKFNNVSYQGNLNQLLDLFLSESGSLVFSGDENKTKIKNIQDVSEKYVNKYFTKERQDHFNILLLKSKEIGENLDKSFYISLAILILIQIVLIKLFNTIMMNLKQKLNFILLTSDYEAKVKFQNSEKIRYMISMIQKKFDIEIGNLLMDKNYFHKRRKSKQPKYNNTKKFLRIAIILIYFTIHIVYVSICQSSASSNIQNSTEIFNLGRSLMRCYTRIVHASTAAAYTGKIDMKQIQQARQSLQFMEDHRGKSAFGTNTDQMVQSYMFENICENKILVNTLFAGETVTCEKATPSFQIENPFSLGVLQYIRRMQYQLINNITETYAVSGVYATPFTRLFNIIATQFTLGGELRINEYINQLSKQNKTLIILSMIYTIFAAYLLWLQSSFAKQIKIVTDFFKSAQEKRLFNDNSKKETQSKQTTQKKKPRQFRTSISGATEETQNVLAGLDKFRKNTLPHQMISEIKELNSNKQIQ